MLDIIDNIKAESTGLYPEFDAVQSVRLGVSIGGGRFGEVYECVSINGLPSAHPQVIKIFHPGRSAKKGLETIEQLQKNLGNYHRQIARPGLGLLERYPAFLGCPQFSFTGEHDGKTVFGYSANNLTKLGFIEFEQVLKEEDIYLEQVPMQQRYLMAWHLAAAFDILRQCFYIHADLKAEAVFIDIRNSRCALIDYDGGAILQKEKDRPITGGTPQQDWWAPELRRQQDPNNVKADIYADIWSLYIGIHYFLFAFAPYFFFKELPSDAEFRAYLKKYRYPQLNFKESYARPEVNAIHTWYTDQLQHHLPPEIVRNIQTNIQQGFFEPRERVSAFRWRTVLSATQPRPEIKFFRSDRELVTDARPVRFEWKVEHASIVLVNGQDVTGISYEDLSIRQDQLVVLEAISAVGEKVQAKKLIEVSKEKPTVYFAPDRVLRIDQRPVKLRWKVTNAASVEIDQGIGAVSNEGEYEVMPRKETVYTLTAVTLFGVKLSAQATIKVLATPPQITRFRANKPFMTKKERVRLSWETHNAEFISIDQGIGDVSGQNYVDVTPQGTTEYTLTATSYFNIEKIARTAVLVSQIAPRVIFFRSDRRIISDDTPVRLSWDVRGSEKIEILGFGEVTTLSYLDVQPQQDTVYILRATGSLGGVTETRHRITTSRKPPNVTFRSSSVLIKKGFSVQLSWQVRGAIDVTINHGIGRVGRRGVTTVAPDEDITYTLIAKSYYGIEARAYITVHVLRPPTLIRPQVTLRNIPALNRPGKKQP